MIKIKEWLRVSLILVVMGCLVVGCNKVSETSEMVGEKVQGEKIALSQVKAEQKTARVKKEQPKLQTGKGYKKVKPKLSSQEKKAKSHIDKMNLICKVASMEVAALAVGVELEELVKIGTPSISALVDALKDEHRNWKLRYLIGNELLFYVTSRIQGKKIDNYVVDGMLEVMEDETDDIRVRKAVAGSLGNTGDKRVVPGLIKMLKEEDEGIKGYAILSLGQLKDERAIKPLVEQLNDKRDIIQVHSVRALCSLGNGTGNREMVEPLLKKLKAKDFTARDVLADEIGRIKDERIVEAYLKTYASLTLAKLWVAGIHDDRIIERLIEILKHNDGVVVGDAAVALGRICDKRTLEPLIETLKNIKTIKGGYGERMVIYAISHIGVKTGERERAIKVLEKALQNAEDEYERKVKDITDEDEKKAEEGEKNDIMKALTELKAGRGEHFIFNPED